MDDETRTIPYIRVTNKNSVPIKDRFDGTPRVILPGQTEQLPYLEAQHYFGLPDLDENGHVPDLTDEAVREHIYHHIVQRYGYNGTKTVAEGKDREFVSNIFFKPVVARLVIEEDVGEEVSAVNPGEGPAVNDAAEEPTTARIPVRSGKRQAAANARRAAAHENAGQAEPGNE